MPSTMELTCEHGEPRGMTACAICRHQGKVERDKAIRQVTEHADGRWFAAAVRAIREIAERCDTLTSEQALVRVIADGWSTGDNRAMGGVMKYCQKQGWITPTEQFVSSSIKSHHAKPTRVWRSLIAQPQRELF